MDRVEAREAVANGAGDVTAASTGGYANGDANGSRKEDDDDNSEDSSGSSCEDSSDSDAASAVCGPLREDDDEEDGALVLALAKSLGAGGGGEGKKKKKKSSKGKYASKTDKLDLAVSGLRVRARQLLMLTLLSPSTYGVNTVVCSSPAGFLLRQHFSTERGLCKTTYS